MKFIKQHVVGTLLVASWARAALRLQGGDKPIVHLTFALTTQGIAAQIVPALLLDDWGEGIKGLGLYAWVREHGLRFPRAELFGFTPDGRPSQYFLRDMEFFAPLVAYAAVDKGSAYRAVGAADGWACAGARCNLAGANQRPTV